MGTQSSLCFVPIAYIYPIRFEQLLTYLHANELYEEYFLNFPTNSFTKNVTIYPHK